MQKHIYELLYYTSNEYYSIHEQIFFVGEVSTALSPHHHLMAFKNIHIREWGKLSTALLHICSVSNRL